MRVAEIDRIIAEKLKETEQVNLDGVRLDEERARLQQEVEEMNQKYV